MKVAGLSWTGWPCRWKVPPAERENHQQNNKPIKSQRSHNQVIKLLKITYRIVFVHSDVQWPRSTILTPHLELVHESEECKMHDVIVFFLTLNAWMCCVCLLLIPELLLWAVVVKGARASSQGGCINVPFSGKRPSHFLLPFVYSHTWKLMAVCY